MGTKIRHFFVSAKFSTLASQIGNTMKIRNYLGVFLLALTLASCVQEQSKEVWAIALHGGAGGGRGMPATKQAEYQKHLQAALEVGKRLLAEGASALDATTQVVKYMEDCPLFNAGKGAVVTMDGAHELDAAVMDGADLRAGAVAGVRDVKNPILAARAVMEHSPHVLLMGEGASAFAASQGLDIVDNSYFSTPERRAQIQRIKASKEAPNPKGTVGCVALDKQGHLAAATSTGGMSGKQWGRVGDVPIIGAGTYANDKTVAVSGTGHGELWIRRCVGFDISALMDYKGYSVERAAQTVIFDKIDKMEGSGGGVICVDALGNIATVFNTELMFRAWATASGEEGCAIFNDTLDSCPIAYNTTYFQEKWDSYLLFPLTSEDIVFVGDDFMDRGIWNELFGTEVIKNRGIATETARGTAARLPVIMKQQPSHVFICTGSNDILKQLQTPSQVAERVVAMVDEAKQASPQTAVHLVGLPNKGPAYEQVNALLKQESAKQKQWTFIDFPQVDSTTHFLGINMNAAGYVALAQALAPYVGFEVQAVPNDKPYPGRHPYYLHRTSLFHSLPVQPGRIIMLGNSLNNNCRWEELIPGKGIINRGISGDVISGIVARLDEVVERQPKKLFLQSGTNDFVNDKEAQPAAVWAQYKDLIAQIRKKLPHTELYVVSMTLLNPITPYYEGRNAKFRTMNTYLQQNAKSMGYTYIDLASKLADEKGDLASEFTFDGIHLSAAAYVLWREAILPYL